MRTKNLIIVGVSHVSPESVDRVKRVIEEIRPDAVAVELCRRRYEYLTKYNQPKVDILQAIKGNVFLFLFQVILTYFQKSVARKFDIEPGSEMIAAIKKANEIGATVILVDRDLSVTLRRFWKSLSLFEKIKLLLYLVRDIIKSPEVDVNKIAEKNVVDNLLNSFKQTFPKASRVLIDERDLFMALKLIQAMKKHDKIVAVVGAGHKRGLAELIEHLQKEDSQNYEESIRELEEIDSVISILKVISVFIILFLLSFFVLTFVSIGFEAFMRIFLIWFLVNGISASVGACIARAHPLSIIAAFFSAWMTSLNPFIAAGWISGVVEAWIRKPTMEDLNELLNSKKIGEMFNNKFFRVLLVAALTNIGSTIGTMVGSYYILTNFGIEIFKVIKSFI